LYSRVPARAVDSDGSATTRRWRAPESEPMQQRQEATYTCDSLYLVKIFAHWAKSRQLNNGILSKSGCADSAGRCKGPGAMPLYVGLPLTCDRLRQRRADCSEERTLRFTSSGRVCCSCLRPRIGKGNSHWNHGNDRAQ